MVESAIPLRGLAGRGLLRYAYGPHGSTCPRCRGGRMAHGSMEDEAPSDQRGPAWSCYPHCEIDPSKSNLP